MLKSTLTGFMLPLLLIFGSSSDNSAAREKQKSPDVQTETVEKLIVANGSMTMEVDLRRLDDAASATEKSKLETLRFALAPDSFFTIVVTNDVLRGPLPGSVGLIPQNTANLPALLNASLHQLVLAKMESGEAYDFVVRDSKSGFVFFNVEGHHYDYDAGAHFFRINDGALLISTEFARQLGRPGQAGVVAGKISLAATMSPIEIQTLVNGEVQSAILPPARRRVDAGAPNQPDDVTAVQGPDVIVGDLPAVTQAGSSGGFVGLGVGTTSCNNGDQPFNWFALPNTDHPVIPQNLYRMSGGASNNDRFEQVGQSWLKHAFTALENNACGFGCNTSGCTTGTHLCVGCSDPYDSGLNSQQSGLGSRAWVNPFTGFYPGGGSNPAYTSRNHTGHTHTGTSHRVLVATSDLNTTLNPGATYFAEGQYVTPHEYNWCQTHSGQCNQYNNASYRQFTVTGTASFTFATVGSTVRMKPAINAWTGAAINQFEPDQGVDGIAFLGGKVTNPSAGVWHYEYAVYNENLDRAIQSFSVPLGPGVTVSNIGFHAPTQEPAWANDGTVGNAGFSSTAWTTAQTSSSLTWSSETFAQNQNANAIRWGTLYNFRFDSNKPPIDNKATVGFFKTGGPMDVGGIQVPTPDTAPTPTPTPTPGPATHFTVTAPAFAISGLPFSFTVTAQDSANQTATGYTGLVHFTSSDPSATLPSNSTLTNGTGTFQATLNQLPTQTITATDTVNGSITGTSNPIAIIIGDPTPSPTPTPGPTATPTPGPATHFAVITPVFAISGLPFSFTVTAQDSANQTATGYTGLVHFTSSDPSATLPSNSTLTNGTGTFQATLNQLPPQTITATDTVNGSITGTSNPIAMIIGDPTPSPAPTPTPTSTPSPTPTPTPTSTPTPTPTPINVSGTISYCSNPVPDPVPNVTLTLSGSGSGSTLSDGSGNYMLSSLDFGGSYTVTPTKAALLPGSAGISTVDVVGVQRHFLNVAPLPAGCRLAAADVNGDTAIDTVDTIAIQRFFLGRTFGLANVGTYQFSPASRAYPVVGSNQTDQNYDTLVFGDVAGPFAERLGGPSQTGAGDGQVASTVTEVALPEVTFNQPKSNFVAAVTSSDIDAKNNLVGFEGDFTFDERVITFQSEPVQKAGITAGNWNVSGNILPGRGPIRTLRISAYSNDFAPLTGSGTLFELRMSKVSKAAQGTQLLWAAAPDQFIFIDADLKTQKPGNAVAGSVISQGTRK